MTISGQIADSFNVASKAGEISWFSASYSLTVGTFILISGRLGDIYGYKSLFLIGYVFLTVFQLICGFLVYAKSTVAFDIFRAMQGIGPAILMPTTQAMIGNYWAPGSSKQHAAFAFLGAVAASGFTLGGLISGALTRVWWPWSYWVGAMLTACVGVVAIFIIPKNIGVKSGEQFDYLGLTVGVTALILINFAWNQGPNVGWEKVYVYVLLIVGALALGAFYFVETRVKNPLVPPAVLRGDTGFVLGCIAAGWSCFGIWIFYTTRWSLLIDHDSALMSAVHMIPACILGFSAAMLSPFLLKRIPLAFVMLIAMVAFLVGIIIMGTRPRGQIFWAQKFVSLLIQPIGMDLSYPSASILLSMALPAHQQGIAGSLVATFVNYAISIGLGFAGTVEYYTTKDKEPLLETTLLGFKNAFRMGMGLAGFGVVLSAVFAVLQFRRRGKVTNDEEKLTETAVGDNLK